MTLYQVLTGESPDNIEAEFDGKGYGHLKRALTDATIASLEPIQARFDELTADPAALESILESGANKAREVAETTLEQVKKFTGLG